jgi:hypothetical protein
MVAIAVSSSPIGWFRRIFGHEPVLAASAIVVALSIGVTLPAMLLDERLFQGDPVWLKPVKFQVALSVYLLTLAAFARWLPDGFIERRWYRAFRLAVVLAVVAELVWIGGAALFGIASHYNTSQPLMARVYPLMGVLAILLTSASLVLGVAIWRNGRTGLPPAIHLSIALGLVMTFILTVPASAVLSGMPGHTVGASADGARLAVLGWSREGGDLRIAHFLATHALHVLPALGLVLAALVSARGARAGVWIGALLLAGIVAAVLAQALMGRPLIPLA